MLFGIAQGKNLQFISFHILNFYSFFSSLVVNQTFLCVYWHVQCLWWHVKSLQFGSDKCPQNPGTQQTFQASVCFGSVEGTVKGNLQQALLCTGPVASAGSWVAWLSLLILFLAAQGQAQESTAFHMGHAERQQLSPAPSLSLLLGPGPRVGWYSFGNTAWVHVCLLERQKNKWPIKSKTCLFPKL